MIVKYMYIWTYQKAKQTTSIPIATIFWNVLFWNGTWQLISWIVHIISQEHIQLKQSFPSSTIMTDEHNQNITSNIKCDSENVHAIF